MIIDCHVHIKGGDYFRREFDPDFIIKVMDEADVNKSVIFSMCLPCYESNDLTLKAYKKYPDRFIPFGHVNPDEGEIALREIDRIVDDLGWKGLKLHFGELTNVSAEVVTAVFEKAFQVGLPCLVDCAGHIDVMRTLCNKFSTGKFIIAHLGSPNNERLIDSFIALAAALENVYLDASYSHVYWKIGDAVRIAGANKIIWGSDGPLMHPAVELMKIKVLNLSQEDEEMILWKNLAGLIKL